MNALKQSIAFYKSKKDKKYDRALLKEEKMLKLYFSKIKAETIPEELLAA